MGTVLFFCIALLIHLILCLLIYIGLRTHFFTFSMSLFPTVALVPVWGMLTALLAEYNSRRHKAGTKPVQLEEMYTTAGDYRTSRMGEETERAVVPLEEAIAINDTDMRRRLMVDILRQNPGQYIQLLQQARLNDDIEITHYASTAIMEVQREYELELQRKERQLSENPEDEKALTECLMALRRYIDSGLLEENVMYIQRMRYAALLLQRMTQIPDDKPTFFATADNYLELEDFHEALLWIEKMLGKWPEDENAWFAKLKYCQKTNDGALLHQTIDEMQSRDIYLTPKGRETLQFWSRSGAQEE